MYDPIAIFWMSLWTILGSYGLYLILTEDKQASSFYVYGKSLDPKKTKGPFWQIFLLPKRYFIHFYLVAVLIFVSSLATVFLYYVPYIKFNEKLGNLDILIREYVTIRKATSVTSITSLLFTLILMIIQSSRRLYETLFISVYSTASKINVLHYIFGHLFYSAAAISTICPILLSDTSKTFTITILVDNLVTKQRALAFVLFIYASHCQHKCHKILANLRKDKTGRVITEQHFVPSGDLFEYASCPHFLVEIILYLLILVAQEFSNYYWNLIFLLVLSTQIINAITEHRWYKKKYTDYPKERKAIFPRLL